jgi:hypothetical protein
VARIVFRALYVGILAIVSQSSDERNVGGDWKREREATEGTFITTSIYEANKLGYRVKGKSYIYVDDQKCNREMFSVLCRKISIIYNVSMKAVEYHLKSYGLVNDERKHAWYL